LRTAVTRIKYLLFYLLVSNYIISQTDTSHFIKVNFLYGSKPKRKYKSTESNYFGGLHGGHVTIQIGDNDYGFEPVGGAHIFPRRKYHADFLEVKLYEKSRFHKDSKTVSFVIPVSEKQYADIEKTTKCYNDTTPFDYAFFGMRCASTTQEILAKACILKKKKRFFNVLSTFYPKKLRKRLFRLAKKNNYVIIRTEGKSTRKWEKD
jgi:hypothetical protein